jgi:hypothetical protein
MPEGILHPDLNGKRASVDLRSVRDKDHGQALELARATLLRRCYWSGPDLPARPALALHELAAYGNGSTSPLTPGHVPPSSAATIPLSAVAPSCTPLIEDDPPGSSGIRSVVGPSWKGESLPA